MGKILIIHGYTLNDSGSCVYVRNLAKGFNKHGYHVTIACQENKAESISGIVRKTDNINFPDDDGITVFLPISPFKNYLLPVYIYNPYDGYDAKAITEISLQDGEGHIDIVSRRLAELINAHDYDFILTNHCLFSPVNVKRALEICGKNIPYVCKIHGSALNFVAAKDERWLPYVYEGLRGARKIICSTIFMKNRLLEVLTEEIPQVELIGCGVDTALFSGHDRVPQRNGRPCRIVFFSHILNTKGIGELLLAIPHIKAKYLDIEFHIIGTGTYVTNLVNMKDALENGDTEKFKENARINNFVADCVDIEKFFTKTDTSFITYHGFLTHDALAPFLASCDVMVAPSKHSEAFGLVTLEAMAAGCLPVVADHSGLSNVVDLVSSYDSTAAKYMRINFPNGNIDIDELIKAISNAIDFVINNEGIDLKLKSIAQNFDWKNICDRLVM